MSLLRGFASYKVANAKTQLRLRRASLSVLSNLFNGSNTYPVIKTKPPQGRCYFNGGGGRIRTCVRLRGRSYNPLPLTTRPPHQQRHRIIETGHKNPI